MEVERSQQARTPTSPKVPEQRLFVWIHRILAELPHSIKLGSRNHGGPRKLPSELCHSPDKAMHNYYTKNESFASGIFKVWCVCTDFHRRGASYRAVGELHRLGWGGISPCDGRPSHMAEWPGGMASTTLVVPLSCRHMSMKTWAKPT
jgi:hypothetical protein